MLLCNPADHSCRVLDVRDFIKHFLFDGKLGILEFFYKRKRKLLLFDNLQSALPGLKNPPNSLPQKRIRKITVSQPKLSPLFSCENFEQDGFLFREIFVKKANFKQFAYALGFPRDIRKF